MNIPEIDNDPPEAGLSRRSFVKASALGLGAHMLDPGKLAAATPPSPAPSAEAAMSARADGRFVSTGRFMHAQLQHNAPRLSFDPSMTEAQFHQWKDKLGQKLHELLLFPEPTPQPPPRRISREPRDGYALERWEAYPEEYCVVPFFLLIPDGVSAKSPAPGVMCFSGSRGSKEMLAGEPEIGTGHIPSDQKWLDNRMAQHFARAGMVAVALDSPATNENLDSFADRNAIALNGLWMRRSYESVSTYQKKQVMDWFSELPMVQSGGIGVCGHSLGAKPADMLALLYPEKVRAIVHNDYVLDWRERIIAMNFYGPNPYQILPGLFAWMDYSDIQAALAPMPLLFTEGGRANIILKLKQAYAIVGQTGEPLVYHYPKYTDPESRIYDDRELPVGIGLDEYFRYANVDAKDHRFRHQHAVPWMQAKLQS